MSVFSYLEPGGHTRTSAGHVGVKLGPSSTSHVLAHQAASCQQFVDRPTQANTQMLIANVCTCLVHAWNCKTLRSLNEKVSFYCIKYDLSYSCERNSLNFYISRRCQGAKQDRLATRGVSRSRLDLQLSLYSKHSQQTNGNKSERL